MIGKYIGKSKVSFENGMNYEIKAENDRVLGECFAIKDESGEWYLYGEKFVRENFEVVE